MSKKAIAVFIPVVAIFSLCLFFGAFSRTHGLFGNLQMASTATLVKQIQALSELVTVKYVVEKVVDVRDVKWYGDNHVLLVADGVVKAGFNLQHLQSSDVLIADRAVTITLPHPVVTDVYLDDRRTQILERTTGVLRAFDKDLEQNARQQALDELRMLALDKDILKEAESHAVTQTKEFLKQLGFTSVEVKFH